MGVDGRVSDQERWGGLTTILGEPCAWGCLRMVWVVVVLLLGFLAVYFFLFYCCVCKSEWLCVVMGYLKFLGWFVGRVGEAGGGGRAWG